MIYILKSESLTVSVSSKGAELISAKDASGKEYVWQADKRYWGRHAPILFPVCGRLLDSKYTLGEKEYNMGAHGFARDAEFSVTSLSESEITLEFSANEETLSVYPFDFTLTVNYFLKESTLVMSIDVKNNGSSVMPYMLGWHPGFTIDGKIDDYTLTFSDGEKAKRHHMTSNLFLEPVAVDFPLENGVYLPTESEIYEKDTVVLYEVGTEAILSRGGDCKLKMKQSDNLPYFAIWKAPYTEAEYICLEPWSDIPSDGVTPECFDTRKMSRLFAEGTEHYYFSVEFIN